MSKPLPTNSHTIIAGLLRSAVALQVAVYEFKDGCEISEEEAIKGVEAASKEIDRLTRALRRIL